MIDFFEFLESIASQPFSEGSAPHRRHLPPPDHPPLSINSGDHPSPNNNRKAGAISATFGFPSVFFFLNIFGRFILSPRQTVKARADANSTQSQRLPLGLTAVEKLHNICQPTTEPTRRAEDGSAQQQLYPYRRVGGVIETVAIRRSNYLLEAARTSSTSGTNTPTSTSGRVTPTFR